jgi:hypothetical protein
MTREGSDGPGPLSMRQNSEASGRLRHAWDEVFVAVVVLMGINRRVRGG